MNHINACTDRQRAYENMDVKELAGRILDYDAHFNDIRRTYLEKKNWEKTKAMAREAEAGFKVSDEMHEDLALGLASATVVNMPQLFKQSKKQAFLYEEGFHAVLDKREDGLYAIARQKNGTLEEFTVNPYIAEQYRNEKPVIVSGEVKYSDKVNWIRIPVVLDLDPLKEDAPSADMPCTYEKNGYLYEKNEAGISRFPTAEKAAPGLPLYESGLKAEIVKLFKDDSPVSDVSCSFGNEDTMHMGFKTTVKTIRPLNAKELMALDAVLCRQEQNEQVGAYLFDTRMFNFELDEVKPQETPDAGIELDESLLRGESQNRLQEGLEL